MAFDKGEGKEKDSKSFVKQYLQASGMALFVRFQLLKMGVYPVSSVV
jgi:hypothetical protein